jgi:hypothetical protein
MPSKAKCVNVLERDSKLGPRSGSGSNVQVVIQRCVHSFKCQLDLLGFQAAPFKPEERQIQLGMMVQWKSREDSHEAAFSLALRSTSST